MNGTTIGPRVQTFAHPNRDLTLMQDPGLAPPSRAETVGAAGYPRSIVEAAEHLTHFVVHLPHRSLRCAR